MPYLLDTNVVIDLRDSGANIEHLIDLGERPFLSAISRVELENGVYRHPEWTERRRAALDVLLHRLVTLDFDEQAIMAYRRIVSAVGYSRRKVIDRMIAATALANGLDVVTVNVADFDDVLGLTVVPWPAPVATPRPPS